MLEEQAAIGDLAADSPSVHRALHVPSLDIVDGVRPEACVRVHEFTIHDIEGTTRVRLQGIYLTRGRRLGVVVSIVACTVLVGWIIVLLLTLHRSFHAQHWRSAWVGFDLLLLAAFAVTGWAFWRGRQIVIACLIVTATLLCCDAWFDVFLDLGSPDIWLSVATAVVVELPMAFLMFSAAGRMIRLSALAAARESGDPPGPGEARPLPPVWKIPLIGADPDGSGSKITPSRR